MAGFVYLDPGAAPCARNRLTTTLPNESSPKPLRLPVSRIGTRGGERPLDFYVPSLDLYIEVKQFSSDRTARQIAGLTNVILIQGIPAAMAFAALIRAPLP